MDQKAFWKRIGSYRHNQWVIPSPTPCMRSYEAQAAAVLANPCLKLLMAAAFLGIYYIFSFKWTPEKMTFIQLVIDDDLYDYSSFGPKR